MTSNDDTFGRDLSRWLQGEGEHRVPDHLREVLVRTAATRQRPWWSSPERWLPMDTVAPSRGMNLRPVAVLLMIGAIVAATLGVAYVASQPKTLLASGPADNGRIFVAANGSITGFAADGTDPQILAVVPAGASGLAISPDGSHLGYYEGPDPGHLRIQTIDGGAIVTVPLPAGMRGGDQMSWSPDMQSVVFPTFGDGKEYIYVASADGTTAGRLGGEAIDPTMGLWYPTYSPDGTWIAFVGVPNGAGKDPAPGTLYVIHPDGTGLEALAQGVEVGGGGNLAWSPEPGTSKLLFVRNGAEVVDVAASKITTLGIGFWATWSPDGRRLAAWQNGLVVVPLDAAPFTVDEYVRIQPAFNGYCPDHPELAGKAICGIATWSPDGTRVIGPDIVGSGMVSLPSDGKGDPILLPGTAGSESVTWQPIR